MNHYQRIIELIVEGSRGEKRLRRLRKSKNPSVRERGFSISPPIDSRARREGGVTPEDFRAVSNAAPNSQEAAAKIGAASGRQIMKGMRSSRYKTESNRKPKVKQTPELNQANRAKNLARQESQRAKKKAG